MEQSKLISLATSLNRHEQKAFQQYLHSPYFLAQPVLLKAFNFFIHPGNREKDKIQSYKVICNANKFNSKEWRYITSFLNKHMEYFLTLRQLDSDKGESAVLCSKALLKKNLQKNFLNHYNVVLKNHHFQDEKYFLTSFRIQEDYHQFQSKYYSRKRPPDYDNLLFPLDTFYLIKKLQFFCEVFNMKNVLAREYRHHLFDEIIKLAEQLPFKEIPAVKIYSLILKTLLHPHEENNLKLLQDLIKKHGSLFQPPEQKDIYQYIKNYCVKKINTGQVEYLRTLFNIYSDMLQNKQLMYYDYFSQWEFKNLVSISLRLKEVAWCRTFINKYINYLPPAERKNASAYNMAYWYFMTGSFKKAIKQLQHVEFSDVFYQLDSRTILLKCYFELDDDQAFFYQASAFRVFLSRNKQLSATHIRVNRNMINYLSQIINAGTSKAKLKLLKEKIEKQKHVADIKWLLEKVNEVISD